MNTVENANKVAARYFDHHLGASVVEYAFGHGRIVWRRTKTAIAIFVCPRLEEEDSFCGVNLPVFDTNVRTVGSNLFPIRGILAPDGRELRGLELHLDRLQTQPELGETLAAFLERSCMLSGDILTRLLMVSIGGIEVVPRIEPVEFVTAR